MWHSPPPDTIDEEQRQKDAIYQNSPQHQKVTTEMNDHNFSDAEAEFMMTAFLTDEEDGDVVESGNNHMVKATSKSLNNFVRKHHAKHNSGYYREWELDDEYELPEPRAPSIAAPGSFPTENGNRKVAEGSCNGFNNKYHTFDSDDEFEDDYDSPESAGPWFRMTNRCEKNSSGSEKHSSWEPETKTDGYFSEMELDDTGMVMERDSSPYLVCRHGVDHKCVMNSSWNVTAFSTGKGPKKMVYEDYYSEEELDDEYELPEPRAPSMSSLHRKKQCFGNMIDTDEKKFSSLSTPSSSRPSQSSSSTSSGANDERTVRDSERQKTVPRKKKTKKKISTGMPKRPMSAYNVFFQEERNRLYEDSGDCKPAAGQRRVGFQELGKMIGQKWKMLSAAERRKYEKISQKDIDRYRLEVDEYQLQRRRRIEALCDLKIPQVTSMSNSSSVQLNMKSPVKGPNENSHGSVKMPGAQSNHTKGNVVVSSPNFELASKHVIDLTSTDANDDSLPSSPVPFPSLSNGSYCSKSHGIMDNKFSGQVKAAASISPVMKAQNEIGIPHSVPDSNNNNGSVVSPTTSKVVAVPHPPSPIPTISGWSHNQGTKPVPSSSFLTVSPGTSPNQPSVVLPHSTFYHHDSQHYQLYDHHGAFRTTSYGLSTWNGTYSHHSPWERTNTERSTTAGVYQAGLRSVPAPSNCQPFVVESAATRTGPAVLISSTPSPPPTTPCSTDDERSDCSGAPSVSSVGDAKKPTEKVEILFAPTMMAFNDFAKLELPANATEVPAPTKHKSSMRVFLPESVSNNPSSTVSQGHGGENKSWYNIEYKCFRMKSSEANAYISKLNDQVKVQFEM